MPQKQFGDILEVNFVNSKRATAAMGNSAHALTTPGDYRDIDSLDSALNTYDAFTYSTAKLEGMCVNDKIFALRSIKDAKSISDYHPTQAARTS